MKKSNNQLAIRKFKKTPWKHIDFFSKSGFEMSSQVFLQEFSTLVQMREG